MKYNMEGIGSVENLKPSCFMDSQLLKLPLETELLEDATTLSDVHSAFIKQTETLKISRVLIELPILEAGPGSVAIPTEKELQRFSQSTNTGLVISSNKGYNFSAEFEYVYYGPTPYRSNFDDYTTVGTRAMQSIDPSLDASQCATYMRLVVLSAMIQESYTLELFSNVLKASGSLLGKLPLEHLRLLPVHLYFGRGEDESLCCWIRMCSAFDPAHIDKPSRHISTNNLLYLVNTRCYTLNTSFVEKYSVSEAVFLDSDRASSSQLFLLCTDPARMLNKNMDAIEDDFQYYTTAPLSQDQRTVLEAPPVIEEVTSSAQIFSWGATGIDTKQTEDLYCLPLPPLLQLQRIRMIACSQTHCIVLSAAGTLFSYGDNVEGALGMGDLAPRTVLTPIEFPGRHGQDEPFIVKIAAASSIIGSHSLALDEEGKVYSWGVAYATGLGRAKPCLVPTLIGTFLNRAADEAGGAPYGSLPAKDIACGGGYSMVVMASGEVAAFGTWAGGRLGLGQPPMQNITRYSSKQKRARYLLTPKYIPGLANVTSVSCGGAHTLFLDSLGNVFSTGSNSHGQLGVGCLDSGFLMNAFTPVRIQFDKQIVVIRCGLNHSLAMDTEGEVWSWGGRGGPQLGQYHHPLTGEWATALDPLLDALHSNRIVPFELLDYCNSWARPAKVAALSGVNVNQVSAGELHSAFVTSDGRLYLCGSAPVVPPVMATVLKEDETETEEGAEEDFTAATVFTPRCPSSVWLDRISTRRNISICSFGQRCFVLQSGDLVSSDLGVALYERAVLGGRSDAEEDFQDDVSIDSIHMKSDVSNRSIFEQRGAADCIVITSGRVLLGHQCILSRRSPVLRELILDENPSDGSVGPCQVLLPELVHSTAKALLYFLYTDELPNRVIMDLALLYALSRASKSFNIPRLRVLCDSMIKLITLSEEGFKNEYDPAVMEDVDIPPCTLARDMGSLVGDPTFADVRFLAEGKSIFAHRFILQNRCQYFSVMFRSGMSDSLEVDGVITVVVPDTFIGFLRLVIFIYTSTLPEGSDGQILEDMMAADRYNIPLMKALCESMLQVTYYNWLDLLRAATMFNSAKLQQDVRGFLSMHPGLLEKGTSLEQLEEEFPGFVGVVKGEHAKASPMGPLVLYKDRLRDIKIEAEKSKKMTSAFPLWTIVILLGLVALYMSLIKNMELGAFIPVINISVAVAVMIFGYNFVTSK